MRCSEHCSDDSGRGGWGGETELLIIVTPYLLGPVSGTRLQLSATRARPRRRVLAQDVHRDIDACCNAHRPRSPVPRCGRGAGFKRDPRQGRIRQCAIHLESLWWRRPLRVRLAVTRPSPAVWNRLTCPSSPRFGTICSWHSRWITAIEVVQARLDAWFPGDSTWGMRRPSLDGAYARRSSCPTSTALHRLRHVSQRRSAD